MNVKVYTMPTCSHCKEAKSFFERNNVEYEEIDITKNEKARNKLLSKGYTSVPVIQIEDEEILGFDQDKVSSLLGIK